MQGETMTIRQTIHSGVSFDEADERIRPAPTVTGFDEVVASALSRRGFLGVMGFGLGAFLAGTSALPRIAGAAAHARFGFENLPANTLDTVTVPEGYQWRSLIHWGDPIKAGAPAFDPATMGTAASQEQAFGDCNDGMALFTRDGRHVLAVNNEYVNEATIWANRPEGKSQDDDDIRKGMLAHGLSIFEVAQENGAWVVKLDSELNRRVTPMTEMELTGPAAGTDLVKTSADPTGTRTLGTWNNCGSGPSLWGTYLTCEENFNGYFASSDANLALDDMQKRYGFGVESRYGWEKLDPRFDMAKEPNEGNRVGYVVEVDPFDPAALPKKRTALGRFKHENAAVAQAADGRVVVYMGDDERGEFLYRYVSAGTWAEGGDPLGLLDEGQLYVARFEADGTGRWLALTPEATGMTLPETLVHTRAAASKVGATTMDRPEWVAVNPVKAEAYVALTNNNRREPGKTNAGGDPMEADGGPNPRNLNVYGQVLRWAPDGGDHGADGFAWTLFALAGNPVVSPEGEMRGSANITADNMFNSPDGLAFDSQGMLWIQTDGDYSNAEEFAGMGHNQMLLGDPETGEIRRFLVGPAGCEVTGLCWSPDRTAMFVGIQHPGEEGGSHFPGGGDSVARSGIVVVTRTDGGPLG
jgi:secreted PhoX family phosphatase